MNFIKRYLIFFIIILLIILNIIIIIIFDRFLSENKLYIFWWVITFEFLLLYNIFFKSLIKPIIELKKEISIFLSWIKKWEQIQFSWSNPDLNFIIQFFNKSLGILKNFKEELKSGKVLKSEVELASEIQKNILNKKQESTGSLDIIANTKSASEVWWDSYDIIKQNDNYYIYLWDVTGHWVASWFVMMIVNALVSAFSKIIVNSAEILSNTNIILKPRVKSNMLMTLLMVRWDEKEKKAFLTWAWHENLLIYKKNDGKTYKIKSWWVALWMTKDISKILKEVSIEFEQWDIIVMYTDWITEARNSKKESWLMFWIDKLIEAIETSWTKTAKWVFNNITIQLSRWMWYDHKQFDDITLIVIHYKWNEIIKNDISLDIPQENITEWNW